MGNARGHASPSLQGEAFWLRTVKLLSASVSVTAGPVNHRRRRLRLSHLFTGWPGVHPKKHCVGQTSA